MSFEEIPASAQPVCREPGKDCASSPSIELIVEPRQRDLGGFAVRRVLPTTRRRMLGPFVFFDHMGPAVFPPGEGMDVRPHPHINLATVTYLFEGEIDHRDSLGSHQAIQPGAINWMTAGRGIVHSERTPMAVRQSGQRLHGIQLWVALPAAHEETAPAFFHHPAASIPSVNSPGVQLRVLAGSAYGKVSPVQVFSPLFYVDARIEAGAELELPNDLPERAAYVATGSVHVGQEQITEPKLLVFRAGQRAVLRATSDARVLLLGGEPLEGPRHIFWNFVSSSPERIERAKRDWA
ncbi:MAG TPA: pirin family protein, partial [Polyangiaceae bacterium]|nr:pirin family protein [Polyangiaceae bacterium]